MKAIILLSCEGRIDNGFRFCSGVENIILDMEAIRTTENYINLVEYLDKIPKVFEAPCCKTNVISNAIYKIWEMSYMDDELYKRVADFYKFHHRCGLILTAKPKT